MILRITTPLKQWPDRQVEKVFLPGEDGIFEVLRGHAPLISSLGKGKICWDEDGCLEIESGFAQIDSDVINVVVE